ncbi:hypothetical protein C8R46DRAFT_1229440 [Mycena filopes]|nr:hypothetical protein C8R46DRAFT_1229440 [Mycena filopes]
MSTTPEPTESAADRSESWRPNPPHDASASVTSTNFVSTRTSQGDAPTGAPVARSASSQEDQRGAPQGAPSPIPSGSPAPKTASPLAPTGLVARLVAGPNNTYFLLHEESGMRIDVIDDENVLTPEDIARQRAEDRRRLDPIDHDSDAGPTVSDESELAYTRVSDGASTSKTQTPTPKDPVSTDSKLASLIQNIGGEILSPEQMATLNQVRGALAAGRDRLFTTTSISISAQGDIHANHLALDALKEEIAVKLADMHSSIDHQQNRINGCVQENVKVLRDLGMSEHLLGQILTSAAKLRGQKTTSPPLPQFTLTPDVEVPEDIAQGAAHALGPRRDGESLEEFGRRAEVTLARKERVAAAFSPPPSTVADAGPTARGLTARFEDVGSISTATRRPRVPLPASGRAANYGGSLSHTGYLTSDDADGMIGDVFADFRRETDEKITDIIGRHLNEEIILPSRIKSPRLENPTKFTGTDDHQGFIKWLEQLAAWMRTMFYGGSDPDTDRYRVSVLKNLLAGSALEWYIEFVENDKYGSSAPFSFVGVLCALHRRFISTATAQQALRDFEAIRFVFEGGPLKLMDDLEACSRRMREPMPEVIIRQRFMKLIPAPLHDDLQSLRGISETYSMIGQMRTQSFQLWDALKTARGVSRLRLLASSGKTDAASTAPSARRTTIPEAKPRANTSASAAPRTASALRTTPQAHSDKTCFKCGQVGHIGSDPICANYSSPNPNAFRPRVGAQRVYDSYAAEDDELADLDTDEGLQRDGWGGSQYEGDTEPGEPVETPSADLAELLGAQDDEPARLGTIRFQYYSMRVDAPDADGDDAVTASALQLMSDLPRNYRPLHGFGLTVINDIWCINTNRVQQGLRLLNEDEERRIATELRQAHSYPEDPLEVYSTLAVEFEALHGDDNWSRVVEDEWRVLQQLQLAEHLRDVRLLTDYSPLAFTREHSRTELALMTVPALERVMAAYQQRAVELESLYDSLTSLNERARQALDTMVELLDVPRRPGGLGDRVARATYDMVRSTVDITADFIRSVSRCHHRRRPYLVRVRYEFSVRSDLVGRLEGPVIHPDAFPAYGLSDFEDAEDEDPADYELTDPALSEPESTLTTDSLVSDFTMTDATPSIAPSDPELWGSVSTPGSDIVTLPPYDDDHAATAPGLHLHALRIIEQEFEDYDDLPSLSPDSPAILLPEEEFAAQGMTPPQLVRCLDRLATRSTQNLADRAAHEQAWAMTSREAQTNELRRALHWELIPGISNEPENPDDPMDARRVWTYATIMILITALYPHWTRIFRSTTLKDFARKPSPRPLNGLRNSDVQWLSTIMKVENMRLRRYPPAPPPRT